MRSEFVFVVTVAAGAAMAVRFIDNVTQPAPPQPVAAEAPAEASPRLAVAQQQWDREVRIQASHDNHYYVNAVVNSARARFLVDTGASFVALRESDARAAGLFTTGVDFNYPVRTANGETRAAMVMLDEMEVSGIRIRDVRAFVLRDEQLATNLLGMSFLNRLESVEARRGELILKG